MRVRRAASPGGAEEELDDDLAELGASLETARSEGRRSEAERPESDSDLALRLERSELASAVLPSGACVPLGSVDLGSGFVSGGPENKSIPLFIPGSFRLTVMT